jgi:hypothetical protein
MNGEMIGPTAVHYPTLASLESYLGQKSKHTDMYQAIVLPLTVGLSKTSENVPVIIAIGALAAMPFNNLKTNKALNEGAKAHAITKILNNP